MMDDRKRIRAKRGSPLPDFPLDKGGEVQFETTAHFGAFFALLWSTCLIPHLGPWNRRNWFRMEPKLWFWSRAPRLNKELIRANEQAVIYPILSSPLVLPSLLNICIIAVYGGGGQWDERRDEDTPFGVLLGQNMSVQSCSYLLKLLTQRHVLAIFKTVVYHALLLQRYYCWKQIIHNRIIHNPAIPAANSDVPCVFFCQIVFSRTFCSFLSLFSSYFVSNRVMNFSIWS